MAIEIKTLNKTAEKDRLRDVVGDNLSKLLFGDILSRGFLWVCTVTWVGPPPEALRS